MVGTWGEGGRHRLRGLETIWMGPAGSGRRRRRRRRKKKKKRRRRRKKRRRKVKVDWH